MWLPGLEGVANSAPMQMMSINNSSVKIHTELGCTPLFDFEPFDSATTTSTFGRFDPSPERA